MSESDPHTERHASILAELAEIGMVMARGLRDEVETAEAPEVRARAVAAFPRIARAVRQTVALEARVRRDAARDQVAEEGRVRTEIEAHVRRRKAQVRVWMQRAICNETPGDDDTTRMRLEDLHDRLDQDILDDDFAILPFEAVIADLHRKLGLSPPTFGADDPDDDEDEDEDEDDEGSDDPAPARCTHDPAFGASRDVPRTGDPPG